MGCELSLDDCGLGDADGLADLLDWDVGEVAVLGGGDEVVGF